MIGRKREVEIKRQRGRDKERENRVVSQGAVGCAGYTDFLQEKNGLQKRMGNWKIIKPDQQTVRLDQTGAG